MADLGRLLTAMVTPFDADLALDLPRAARLAKQLLATGTEGLVVCGTTGESPTLSHDEKVAMFKTVIETVGGEKVVAGTGSNDTRATIALSKEAKELGAAGLLLIAPYYNKPDQEGLYRHFKAVADAVDLPIILYNHPPRTGVSLAPATVARLARECRNIVALKDSSASLDVVSDFIHATPATFRLYSGNDTLTLPIMALGGHGAISVAAHVAGPELRDMIALASKGHFEEARKIHFRLWDLMNGLFMTPSPAPTKAALAFYGGPVGGVRLPIVDMTPEQRVTLESILTRTLGEPAKGRELADAHA
ncbi:MAG: 4-hydroxy-tetrahydrodipicolinate synthase [Candidatus Sericytochromatia bacterium]|nr:4-hydroxy-tetrahydrodipicolinate synthase [Candidatus Tanganyikabacteria bacterium]